MRLSPFSLVALLLLPLRTAPEEQGRSRPPGIATRDTLANHPLERPVETRNRKVDLDQVKREAEELRNLAEGLPDRVHRVAEGQVAKDLPENLKRIEELARHLHSELVP